MRLGFAGIVLTTLLASCSVPEDFRSESFTVFVDRPGHPITLQEWVDAVDLVDRARLSRGPIEATNPTTGQVISLGHAKGDAEAFVGGRWMSAFLWHESGRVSFSVRAEKRFVVLTLVARALAASLGAKLIDEYGDAY